MNIGAGMAGMAGKLKGKRILIVEDEYFIASDLKRALLAEDATVVGPVGRLDQGLALSADGPLDAAILDVNLGDATTYPIAERLAVRGVPWVFVTGYDDWALPATYRDMPRVAKPFAPDAVLEAVASVIAPKSPA